MKSIFSVFNKPYPHDENDKRNFISSIAVALLITAFLAVFQPFGLHHPIPDKMMVIAGYGLVTFICMVLVLIGFPKIFKSFYYEDGWTIGKEIISVLLLLSIISIGNLLYGAYLGFYPLTLSSAVFTWLVTITVGLFPTTAFIMIKHYRLLKRHIIEAEIMNDKIEHHAAQPALETEVTLVDEEGKNGISLTPKSITLIAAADNYVEIIYDKNGKAERVLLRNSLKSMEQQLAAYSFFFRCHRSYIVNLEHIQKVSGNSQGYGLTVTHLSEPVPVARAKAADFKKIIS